MILNLRILRDTLHTHGILIDICLSTSMSDELFAQYNSVTKEVFININKISNYKQTLKAVAHELCHYYGLDDDDQKFAVRYGENLKLLSKITGLPITDIDECMGGVDATGQA